MAVVWNLRLLEMTSTLIGVIRPEQITNTCEVLGNSTFSGEELAEIDRILNS